MAFSIYKFTVPTIGQVFEIETREKSYPLTTQIQSPRGWVGGQMVFWLHVDLASPVVKKRFIAVGTGHDAPDGLALFVGTCQDPATGFVWHLFGLP